MKFFVRKEIKNRKKSKMNEENEILIDLIKKGYSNHQLKDAGYGFTIRRINKWRKKLREGYIPGLRKVRTPKPKPKNEILQKCFNCKLEDIEKEEDKKFITNCLEIIKTSNFKNLSEQQKNNILKRCGVCGGQGELIYCNKCNDGFHKKCTNGIEDFRCERCINELKVDLNDVYNTIKIYSIINREVKGTICNEKIIIPKMTKLNLNDALQRRNSAFDDNLVYSDICPQEMNSYLLENGIQELSEENIKIYKKFKQKSQQGFYGPIEVVWDETQGYIAKATATIKMNTIISEYSGQVFFFRDGLFMTKGDSTMELIHSPVSDTSLVIIPKDYGNLARFLSGINNTEINNKQNVYSLRVNIEGSIHVLLLAKKK